MKDKIKHYVIEEKDYTKSIFFFILHFFLFGGVYAGVVSLITYYMLTSGFEFTVEQSLFMSVSIWWLLYLIKLY
jgi:ABC-type lipoprotein release transport system permease subunit